MFVVDVPITAREPSAIGLPVLVVAVTVQVTFAPGAYEAASNATLYDAAVFSTTVIGNEYLIVADVHDAVLQTLTFVVPSPTP